MVKSGAPAIAARQAWSSGSPSTLEVMTSSAGAAATVWARLASCSRVSRSAQCTSSTTSRRGRRALAVRTSRATVSRLPRWRRGVVHGVVERAQLQRLRQIEQVVEVDPVLVGDQALGDRARGRRDPRLDAAAAWHLQQAADQRADRVLPGARAEVEHQALVLAEAQGLGLAPELLDQPGLADAGAAAQVDRVPGTAVATGLEQPPELGELRAPADEGAGGRRPDLGRCRSGARPRPAPPGP